jgi:hypothetical protein
VPLKRGFVPVAFDDLAWQNDLSKTTGSAKRIGEETRSRLEREGQAVDALFACDEDARDGTILPACVKVYLRRQVDRSASSTGSRRARTGGSISITWPSACAICRPEFAARRSIAAPTVAYTVGGPSETG